MSNANPYGVDLWWNGDIDPYGREVGGTLVLAQACARRLSTPRGQLLGDPNYGYDLSQWLNADIQLGQPQIAQIQSNINAELLKDERVLDVQGTTVFVASQEQLVVTVGIVGAAGPFTLVLAVSSVTVQILQPVSG